MPDVLWPMERQLIYAAPITMSTASAHPARIPRDDALWLAQHGLADRAWALRALPEPATRGRGRPQTLNPERVTNFLMCIRAGVSRSGAARLTGISEATLYRWLRDTRRPYRSFRRRLVMAEAEVLVRVTANLVNLSKTSTRAARFFLENRDPAHWGPQRRRPGDRAVADTASAAPRQIVVRHEDLPKVIEAIGRAGREQAATVGAGTQL